MKIGYGVSVATVGVLLAACAPSGEESSGGRGIQLRF